MTHIVETCHHGLVAAAAAACCGYDDGDDSGDGDGALGLDVGSRLAVQLMQLLNHQLSVA